MHGWVRFRAGAKGTVRARLELDEHARELHRVRREALRDPEHGGRLLADQNVWFSRFLRCANTRQIRPRAGAAARALVAAVCPTDLAGPPRFDPAGELAAVRASLGGWPKTVTPLADPIPRQLRTELDTGYDVFHLVAHGAVAAGRPKLLLADEHGRQKGTDADELVSALKGLRSPPRLVVLASCQSAGADPAVGGDPAADPGAALGPELGRVGIPAVVAMLGNVFRSTATRFVTAFFEKLEAGQVDEAAAAARVGADPARVRRYLKALFAESNLSLSKFSIYWGSRG